MVNIRISNIIPGFIYKRIGSNPEFSKIFFNMGWLFWERLLRILFGVAVGVWVARYLGPEDFGKMNYAIAFVGLFMVLSKLGLDGIVVRELVKNPLRKNELLGSTFLLKLIGGSLAFLVILFFNVFLLKEDSITCLLIIIFSFGLILRSFETIDLLFKAQVLSKYTVIAKNISLLISASLKIGLILIEASVIEFVIVTLFEVLVIMIVLIYFFYKNGNNIFRLSPRFTTMYKLISESWPLIFSGLAVAISIRIDKIMIGIMLDDEAVGIYSAASRLSEYTWFIPVAVASSMLPFLVKSKELGEVIYLKRMQKYFNLNAMLAYIFILPLVLFSNFIINFLYGNAYQGAAIIFAIHIWSLLFVFIGTARSQYLVIESLLKFSLFANLLGAVSNVVLNLLLIPIYNETGAAIATIITLGISTYLITFFYKKTIDCGLMQSRALMSPFLYSYTYIKKSLTKV